MMKRKNVKQISMVILTVLVLMLLSTTVAMAGSSSGMPWEGPVDKVVNSISGPVATAMAVLAIVGCGLGIAFGEGGRGMKKLMWVVIGVAIVLLASRMLTTMGLTAGLTF